MTECSTENLEQLVQEIRATLRAKRDHHYPSKHREKYADHEFVRVCGVSIRKLSAREVDEFQKAVDRGPLKPIRLDVA